MGEVEWLSARIVWARLFTDVVMRGQPEATATVRAYRERMGVAGEPRVGVVVQRLIRADAAGAVDRDGALGQLRRFLKTASGIRARATSPFPEDVERLIQAAAIVEEIAGALPAARFEDDLPATIVGPARTLCATGS